MTRIRVVAILVCALPLGATGCGGEDEPDREPAPRPSAERPSGGKRTGQDRPLTAAEYRRRGNRICREAEREAERIVEGLDPEDRESVVDVLRRTLSISESYDRRFARLRPPPRLSRLHQQAIRDGREVERVFRRLLRRAEGGDELRSVIRDMVRSLAPLVDRGNRTARALGLKDCVEPLTPPAADPGPERS